MVKAFDYVKGDHMELKDFISETLVEISTGVLEAAEKLQGDKKQKKCGSILLCYLQAPKASRRLHNILEY